MCTFLCEHKPSPYWVNRRRTEWSGMLDHMMSMSSFVRNCETVLQRLYYFAFPWAMNESSCCSTSLPTFGIVSVPDFGHSYRCLVISHCCFILHFPDDEYCGTLFPTFICYPYVFFGKVSVKIRLFSYYWVLSILYIFWIIVLY